MKKLISSMAVALFVVATQDALYSQQTQSGTQKGVGTRPSELPEVGNSPNSQTQPSGAQNGVGTRPSELPVVGNSGQSRPGGYYPDDESPWFDNDNLRRELELDDDQIKRLNDAYGSTWKQLRGNQADSNRNNQSNSGRNSQAAADRDQVEQQRSTRLNEYRSRFDDEFNRSTSEIFRNRQQQERFNQLRMQHQGYGAFNNPALQRQMNLNDTQKRQLQELNREWDTQMDEFRNSYSSDREGTSKRYNDFNQSSRTRFEGILNDQQRQQYNEMTGDQFDFGADARLGNRNTNARANASGEGSGLGTPQDNGPQGSGIGTQTDTGPQGSGLGTQTDTGPQGSGLGTNTGAAGGVGTNDRNGTGAGAGATGTGSGSGSGTGAGSGTGTGAGAGTGGGAGTGSGAGAGSGSGSGSGSGGSGS